MWSRRGTRAAHIANHLSLADAFPDGYVGGIFAQVQVGGRVGGVVPYLYGVPASAFVSFLYHNAIANRHYGRTYRCRIVYARVGSHHFINRVFSCVGEMA